MGFIELFVSFIEVLNNFIILFYGSLIVAILILLYHILMRIMRDKKYINALKRYKDPKTISIEDLNSVPLVTIIVPAWKEGESFRQCLNSIKDMKYPNKKVIVNAGGSDETNRIADSFKKFDNFLILRQKGGSYRPQLGKVRAINECLSHIQDGIIYSTDADVQFNDEILLRMLYPLTNENEKVVICGIRPYQFQEKKDLVLYLKINRNLHFRKKFDRYHHGFISGANSIFTYDVLKAIGKFSEDIKYADDRSREEDIEKHGFKIYALVDYRGRIFTKFPDTIKAWFSQKLRWNTDYIIFSLEKNKVQLIKPLALFCYSLFLIIFPFLGFLNPIIVVIGVLLLFSTYLKKIRRLIFYVKTNPKQFIKEISWLFYLKLIIYIYIEALIYLAVPYDLYRFKKEINPHKSQ